MKKAMFLLLTTAVAMPLLSGCRDTAADKLSAPVAKMDSAEIDRVQVPPSFDFSNYGEIQLIVQTDKYQNWGATQYVKVFLNKDPRQVLYLGEMNRERKDWVVTVSLPKGATALAMESYDELGDTVEIDLTSCLAQQGVCYVL